VPSPEKAFVIIPAYNEELRIASVIEATQNADPDIVNVDFVTVIDNNSTDLTLDKALSAGARVISCERQGKGWSMETGARHARYLGARALTFLDGDLVGLNGNHVSSLAKPVVEGLFEMTIGYLGGRKSVAKLVLERWGAFSGQRSVSMDIWNELENSDFRGWRTEGALNAVFRNRNHGEQISRIELEGLRHLGKRFKKPTLVRAGISYVQTYGSATRGLLSRSGK
jgi:glycosyltransferase involved in cell wall biosynthesis